jgi:hypothetical protein
LVLNDQLVPQTSTGYQATRLTAAD